MSLCRDVSTLPLARSVVEVLLQGGFRTVNDLLGIQPTELSRELNLSLDTSLAVLQCINTDDTILTNQNADPNPSSSSSSSNGNVLTAKDLVERAVALRPIITYSRSMDLMLGGGVCIGQLTEFCGPPGVGKTQICVQLCIDVQLPRSLTGAEGEAVFIDTEGSFMVERAAEMADAMADKVRKKLHQQQQLEQTRTGHSAGVTPPVGTVSNYHRNHFLNGMHVFRAHDQTELLAITHQLSAFLTRRPAVKLVVIDSVAFHFRQDLQDASTRSRVLSSLAQTLNDLAHDHEVAVVVTNHVTTRVDRDSGGIGGNSSSSSGSSSSRIVPALGELWSHCVTNRVMLQPVELEECAGLDSEGRGQGGVSTWDRVCACALVKSPSRPLTGGRYRLCALGVRDVTAIQPTVDGSGPSNDSSNSSSSSSVSGRKRVFEE